MTALKHGDRVRVAFEGVVTYQGSGYAFVEVDGRSSPARVWPEHCEVIAPAIKVGDVIEGRDAYEALPVGAIVAADDGKDVNIRTVDGFADFSGRHYLARDLYCPRKLVYLPGVAQ